MADREPSLLARIEPGIGAIDCAHWDRLAGTDDPFLSHAFLTLLEDSGSVGPETGWSSLPIIIERDGKPLAATPAYLKMHSQGEYVFDHGWAEAFERAGGAYYPKLQVAVPFTPVPGQRLLGNEAALLWPALEAVVQQNGLSSAHITFCTEAEAEAAAARGWLRRTGLQFHWFNRGYVDFGDFLARLSSRKRKAIRKERQAAVQGLEVEVLRGTEIGAAEWDSMWHFYQDTGSRKWGRPYLTRAAFDLLPNAMGERSLLILARRDGVPVAGALNFIGSDALYGRYWGALEEIPFLHFELSYYRAIDWAIAHGLSSVQAGAQGEHKLARGYEAVITHSVHYLPDPAFHRAVEDFLERERAAVEFEMEAYREALPYRSDFSS